MPELHSLLFLIRHLLMLKKIIIMLELTPTNVTNGVDLSSSKSGELIDLVDTKGIRHSLSFQIRQSTSRSLLR